MLDEAEHAHFSEVLSAWGMARADIEDTLRWATFGPGAVEMSSSDPQMPAGLGIVVDETRDEELARMFTLREHTGDDEFMAQWQVSTTRTARTVLDPTSPQAVFRYAISIERPERIERRFLFLVHAIAPQLAGFQRPGTQLWLIPRHVAQPPSDGLTGAYEVLSRCLPIGTTQEPLPALEQALTHVRHGAPQTHSMNRAQRRQAKRGR